MLLSLNLCTLLSFGIVSLQRSFCNCETRQKLNNFPEAQPCLVLEFSSKRGGKICEGTKDSVSWGGLIFLLSISAVQWLCNADKKSHSPVKRLYRFFSTLYTALVSATLYQPGLFCSYVFDGAF